MSDLHSILDAWRLSEKGNRTAVLATVVETKGSTYRLPGERILLLPNGRSVGLIGNGPDREVCGSPWWSTDENEVAVRVFDSNSAGDAIWEFGLSGNGVAHVLLERLDTKSAREVMSFLDECRASSREAVVATVVRTGDCCRIQAGDRLFVTAAGCSGGLRDTPLEKELLRDARTALGERKNRYLYLGDCEVFLEWVGPPMPLVVFGAGHDAIPLVAAAKAQGWHVTVADDRPAYARTDRFPGADRMVVLPSHDPANLSSSGIDIGPRTAVVVMTHDDAQDTRLIAKILPLRPAYLGLVATKSVAERLLRDLDEDPATPGLYAPAGLDIGAGTPASVAFSVVAEVQAVTAGRPAGMRSSPRNGARIRELEIGQPPGVRKRASAGAVFELV